MSKQVTHDGLGALELRFPFDRDLVDLIKSLPQRRWNAADRFWSVPETDVVRVVDLLVARGFEFDRATRDLYVGMGGTPALAAPAARGAAPRLPGLFDGLEDDGPPPREPDAPADAARGADDYTVSRLNERVREAIQSAFPAAVWLVGEISGFNKSAHRKHVSFELVERAADGRVLSKIPAVLFGSERQAIEERLRASGDPFRLEDEVSVRVRVGVDLYVAWGQYRVVVEELDPRYTLGEAARRREEIVRRLAAAGLLGRNGELPVPRLPLRVGLITSLGSDAFNDVRRTLEESGYAFELTAHGARVQGHLTEPSVLNALDWFRARAEQFDLLLICRGGGARTDLVGFDSEPLGRAVAEFPLPVVVGIGHEQDLSVLDAVARSAKTPTAAAAWVVDRVRDGLGALESLARAVMLAATKRIRDERRGGVEHARRLARAAQSLLRHERSTLVHRRRRAVLGARAALGTARDRLSRWTALIPRDARVLLERQSRFLDAALRGILHGARRELREARAGVVRSAQGLGPRSGQCLTRERERVDGRARRLTLCHPRRVLDRGYSILRLADGTLLSRPEQAQAGQRVAAELRGGRLNLRSEGPDFESEGD